MADAKAEVLKVCPVAAGKCHYTTVQEAVDAAQSGDTIQIEPGVYDGTFSQIGTKDLTIRGAGSTRTILFGGMCGPPPPGRTACAAFQCSGGATVRIANVTLTHHADSHGAGIDNHDCTITVKNSTIQDNSASTTGGGIENHGTMTIENVDLQNNAGDLGGGIVNFGTLTITKSHIQNNSALVGHRGGPNGGGILNGGTVVMEDTDVSNNYATQGGGGIANAAGNMFLKRSTVHSNISYDSGGGIWNSGTVLLANSFIDLNFAAVQGGGIFEAGGMIMDTAGETWYVDNKPDHCANPTGTIPCP